MDSEVKRPNPLVMSQFFGHRLSPRMFANDWMNYFGNIGLAGFYGLMLRRLFCISASRFYKFNINYRQGKRRDTQECERGHIINSLSHSTSSR